MKHSTLVLVMFGVLAGRAVYAQTVCAGAEGASKACAQACSGTIINEDTNGAPSQGKFNVGGNNLGDGNDGFNNQGSFNIGSGNKGNCALGSGLTGGVCDVNNNNGRMVLRYCQVLPADPKCNPGGYLPEFTKELTAQIAVVVASCNGGPTITPIPTSGPTPPSPATPAAPPQPVTPVPTPTVTIIPAPTKKPTKDLTTAYGPSADYKDSNTANLIALLDLFAEKLGVEQSVSGAGRKMKL